MDSNKKTKSYFVDRISGLPECIMHHILSFLRTKDVARTSVLSKRWNSVWTCFPILDFDEWDFCCCKEHGDYKVSEKVANIVDCALQKFCTRKLQVQKFRLNMTYDQRFEFLVKKWIDQLTKNQVRELDFEMPGRYYTHDPMPKTIFAVKSLISLNLNSCYFAQPFSKDDIRCCSLKILSLKEMNVSEMMIQLLIGSCPLIEVFVLRCCRGFSNLRVSGLLKLKTVEVISTSSDIESINIESPSLQSFHFGFRCNVMLLQTINVSACQGLRNLTLIRVLITSQLCHDLASNLPFLEDLFLANCDVQQGVKISSPRLKRLTLRNCEKLEEAMIDTPDLHSFQIVGQTLPVFSSLNAPYQLEVVLYLGAQPDALWHLKLKEFLKKANQAKVLTLIIMSSMNIWNKNMRLREGFSLLIQCSPLSFSGLLNTFIFSGRPGILFIVSDSTSENKFVKNLCAELTVRTDQYCCFSMDFDFWWNKLYGNIANFEETEDEKQPLCRNALPEEATPSLHKRQKLCFRLQYVNPHFQEA